MSHTLGAAPYTPERPPLWTRFAAAVEWLVELPALRRHRQRCEVRPLCVCDLYDTLDRLRAET